jgi:hypothetical protein
LTVIGAREKDRKIMRLKILTLVLHTLFLPLVLR